LAAHHVHRTGTGNDRISFRENDTDTVGALIDDVRLVAT
jgi:hypothetical protein